MTTEQIKKLIKRVSVEDARNLLDVAVAENHGHRVRLDQLRNADDYDSYAVADAALTEMASAEQLRQVLRAVVRKIEVTVSDVDYCETVVYPEAEVRELEASRSRCGF